MNTQTFVATQFDKLDFFTKQIVKVHGRRHPELTNVRLLFVQIKDKLNENIEANVRPEFAELEKVTSNFKVPDDACEAYSATYQLLQYMDGIAA